MRSPQKRKENEKENVKESSGEIVAGCSPSWEQKDEFFFLEHMSTYFYLFVCNIKGALSWKNTVVKCVY
uniref:Uncharacterized protein n=1 Tax=Leersia perrieri TaxID=77586 RepID=A0A0D9VVA6_9ORYZ